MAATIIRGTHDKDNPYFLFRRDTAQDRSLSWEARGVLAYLLSKPDDWKVQVPDLQQLCGREKVKSILRELVDKGYLTRKQVQNEDGSGQFSGSVYLVYETPVEKPSNLYGEPNSPKPENPSPKKPSSGEPPLTNNRIQKTESTNPAKPGRINPNLRSGSKSSVSVSEDDTEYIGDDEAPKPRHKSALEVRLEGALKGKKLSKKLVDALDAKVLTSGGEMAGPRYLWDINPTFKEWANEKIAYWETLPNQEAAHLVNLLRTYENAKLPEQGWVHFEKRRTAEVAVQTTKSKESRAEIAGIEGVPIAPLPDASEISDDIWDE